MKTREDKRQSILNKITEVESLKEVRSDLDFRLLDEDGRYNTEVLTQYLEINKKINYAKAAVVRMIKRLMNDIYESWPWSEKS